MKKTTVISFANQKGGAGKSTIGTLVASVLAYQYGYKVAMLDCDYPQYSLHVYRTNEQNKLQTDDALLSRLEKQNIPPYPIAHSKMSQAVDSIDKLEEQGFDFILVDTPGTLNIEGIVELLTRVDYIFLPMKADIGDINSTMSYIALLGQFLQVNDPESNLKSASAFWNMYMKVEKKEIYQKTTAFFAQKGLPLLNSRVEALTLYKDGRSTFFPLPERKLAELGLGRLIREILVLINGSTVTTPNGKVLEFTPVEFGELEDKSPAEEGAVKTDATK